MVSALRQAAAGMPRAGVCRKFGMTERTAHRWKR